MNSRPRCLRHVDATCLPCRVKAGTVYEECLDNDRSFEFWLRYLRGAQFAIPFFPKKKKKKKKKKERKTDITLSKIDDRGIRRVNIATNIWKRPRNFSRILGKLIYLEISRMSFVFVSGHHFSPKLPPRVFFTTKRRKERGNKQRFSFTFI